MIVKFDDKILQSLMKIVPEKMEDAVNKTAFRIEGFAKGNAPVDLGALKAGIHTRTHKDTGGWSASISAANSINPSANATSTSNTPKFSAEVVSSVNYSPYVEFGRSGTKATYFMTRSAYSNLAYFKIQVAAAMQGK